MNNKTFFTIAGTVLVLMVAYILLGNNTTAHDNEAKQDIDYSIEMVEELTHKLADVESGCRAETTGIGMQIQGHIDIIEGALGNINVRDFR